MPTAVRRRKHVLVAACVLVFFATGWLAGTARSTTRTTFVRMEDTHEVALDIPVVSLTGEPGSLDLDGAGGRLMLFVLSPTCRFCEQNMSWWRRVADSRRAADGSARIVVLSVGESSAAREFLVAHGLEAPLWMIDEAALEALGVPAVPATVAVDVGQGVVHRWIGVIDDGLERDLAHWIGSDD